MKKCLSGFAVDRLSTSEAAFQLRHQQARGGCLGFDVSLLCPRPGFFRPGSVWIRLCNIGCEAKCWFFLSIFFHVSQEVRNLPDAWEWGNANLVQQPWWKTFHLTQNSWYVLTAQCSASLPEWIWLVFACDSEQRCFGNIFHFFFPSEKWSESLSKVMVIWELGRPNEEVKPSYKMSSAHCTYLLSADISLTSKYELVTSLWGWYCSESSFWLEHDGATAGPQKEQLPGKVQSKKGHLWAQLAPWGVWLYYF